MELITLDEYLCKIGIHVIDFLKIDTEGHELEVLRGAINVLKNSPGALVMFENSDFHDVNTFFVHIHWKTFSIDDQGHVVSGKDSMAKSYNLFACGPSNPLYLDIS